MSGNAKLWVGLGVTVVLLVLFLLTVDLGGMLEALGSARYEFLVPAIAVYLLSVLFRTIRWQRLLRHMQPISIPRLYPVVVVGYMANNLLPMRLGELVRSYYVGEREGVSKTSALVTIFVERLLDALTLLFFVAAIAVFVPLTGVAEAFGESSGVYWPLLVAAVSVPFVVAFASLLLMAFAPSTARVLAVRVVDRLPVRVGQKLVPLVDLFLDGLKSLGSPGSLLGLFVLSIPIWLLESGLFFFIGFSFGFQDVYDNLWEMAAALVLVTAIANIGASIPAAPGGIGLFELVARETLVLLPLAAVDRAVAGGYVAVVHASLLLPMIIGGQLFLWMEHVSLRSLSRAGQTVEASPKSPPNDLSPEALKATGLRRRVDGEYQ